MNSDTRQRSIRRTAFALASPPLLLLLFLLIVNPGFIRMVFDPGTIEYALPLVGLIAILTAAAYPAMLGSLTVFNSGRRGLGILLVVLALALLVFPATLLLILVPAVLELIRYYSGTPVP